MDPITLTLLALGGLALVGRRPHPSSAPPDPVDRQAMLLEIRSMATYYSKSFHSMPRLADYLTVIGFRESNFNPNAINPEIKTNPNAARGLFGFRPDGIFKKSNGLEHMRKTPNALLNPRWSFVCAVFHIWDACDRLNKNGLTPNYAAIRRWWGLPSYVYDYDLESEFSKKSLARLERAIDDCNRSYGTNIDPDFIWEPISGWQNYPGMDAMLQVYGLD